MSEFRSGDADRDAAMPSSTEIRTIVVSLLIVVGGTIFGALIGTGGAFLLLVSVEGEARGGPIVLGGILMMAGAGLGLIGGIVCSAGWLRRKISALPDG